MPLAKKIPEIPEELGMLRNASKEKAGNIQASL
jgi:hypothetical protein